MRQIVNLNRSGLESSSPAPSAPGVLPQYPEADEFSGTAFLVSPLGDMINPAEFSTKVTETPIWLLACSIINGSPTICRVEAIYQVVNISDAFQLQSNRSGRSVQVILLSKPGQGNPIVAELIDTLSVLNVYFDDFQTVNDSAYLFRPAYDRVSEGGGYVSAWTFQIPETEPTSFVTGYLKWTDNSGIQRSIPTLRSPKSTFTTSGRENLLTHFASGRYESQSFSTVLRFDLPCGYQFPISGTPENDTPSGLIWMCWVKPSGSRLQIGLSSESGLTSLDQYNVTIDAAVLRPLMYLLG